MEDSVVFPDAELAKKPEHSTVFTLKGFVRPQSAGGLKKAGRVSDASSIDSTFGQKHVRPWTAQPKTRSNLSARKIPRETLRKSHLKPPSRSSFSTTSSDGVLTAVGRENAVRPESRLSLDENKTPQTIDLSIRTLVEDPDRSDIKTKESWAVKIGQPLNNKPKPEDRKLSKHSSFESWIAGSPHDSDEYDTDLDIEDFVKSVEDERPSDPTGRTMYQQQCRTQGIIPVSYLQRHLGDRNVQMRHHYLGGSGTKAVAVAMKFNTITENIDLADNYVEMEGARHLAHMLNYNTFITTVNLSNNFIGKEGFVAFAEMLESNTTLKSLCLAGNQLTDSCAKSLVEALKSNMSLSSLDLSNNDLGEQAGIYIGAALSLNEGLVDLDLSWNAIRNKGAVAVANALASNKTLEVLDLSWNGVGQTGTVALQQALKVNTTLKVLDLSNNRINTQGAQSLAIGLRKNFGLETLLLNLNPIRDEGMEAILKAAECHSNLHFLSLEEMSLSHSNYLKIQDIEAEKDLMILHGGVGGYQRNTASSSMLMVFTKFLRDHSGDVEVACRQHDKDENGHLTLEDLKLALKAAGLRLTNRQLNVVISEMDYNCRGIIKYRDILSGELMSEYYRRRPSRAFTTTKKNLPDLLGIQGREVTIA